ncbi:MAG: IS21-like element helper ATPase IstB [Pyrinomonadaceae bacterium]
MRLYEELAKTGLEDLKMTTSLGNLDTVSQEAAAGNWSYSHFLGYLLDGELKERQRLRVKMSLQFARFPYLKRIDDFDYSVQPSVDRRLIEELHTLRFVDEGRNIIFLGPPGVGKTHLAIGLGVALAEQGRRAYFTTAIDLVTKLTKALHENRLSRIMKNLTRPKLLIIDEVGYLKLDKVQASLLFQVISGRYERESATIMTSNKAFGEWGDVFAGDAVMASAALDRLLHRSTILKINGDSYRMMEKKKAGIKLDEPAKTAPKN